MLQTIIAQASEVSSISSYIILICVEWRFLSAKPSSRTHAQYSCHRREVVLLLDSWLAISFVQDGHGGASP